uniref:Uncharacterized protein n=1 Tax=Candidatus Kentrum sp. SD TaxID=2126332 RepID=A0A450Y6C6_9GAMM|nr:MAG: hypothetical protein BECKSD772F_GA0070984_10102 [Candidatus Kentron sp. SD]VFK48966.1 MAG: hypothetical protein BECKSD772E_GA0070983_11521 [Candidatus Kentron sp. SD]
MTKPNEHSILEAALETSEVGADILTDDQVLSGIPVFGTVFNSLKTTNTIRDRIFAAKLSQFIAETNARTAEKKREYREKLKADPDASRRVGETLLLVLENLTDMDKPRLLGRVFIAYLEDAITVEELKRLSQAIQVAFMDDLARLLNAEGSPAGSQEPWMESLLPLGLVRAAGGETWSDVGKFFYDVTPIGKKLRNACLRTGTE